VNVLIEESVRELYEWPPLASLQRIATQARHRFNETIYSHFQILGARRHERASSSFLPSTI
jgi:hypothetical protein